MANLKIRVSKKVVVFEVNAYRPGDSLITSLNNKGGNRPTYNSAKLIFNTLNPFAKGLTFLINKTDIEAKAISDANISMVFFNIKSENYNNEIKKIRVNILKSEYYVPEGKYELYTDKSISSSNVKTEDSVGNSGEIFIGDRSTPTGESTVSFDVVLPNTLPDGYVIPLKSKIYSGISLNKGFNASALILEFNVQLIDGDDKPITFKNKFNNYLQSAFTYSCRTDFNCNESRRPTTFGNAIALNNNLTPIITDGSNGAVGINIQKLPDMGELKLNGVNVGLYNTISLADLESGKLTYTPTSQSGKDFISFTTNIPIGQGYVVEEASLYFDIS